MTLAVRPIPRFIGPHIVVASEIIPRGEGGSTGRKSRAISSEGGSVSSHPRCRVFQRALTSAFLSRMKPVHQKKFLFYGHHKTPRSLKHFLK
jgi:hypothetical protein